MENEDLNKKIKSEIESQIRIARDVKLSDYNLATMIFVALEMKGFLTEKLKQ
jgi:hypothetical protein